MIIRSSGSPLLAVAAVASISSAGAAQTTPFTSIATSRVSVSSAGTGGNAAATQCSISADGRIVAFVSAAANLIAGDANGVADVFVHDRVAGTTVRVSVASDGTEADGPSGRPSVSADGRFVAFESTATNLVASDGNGSTADVFVHDLQLGTTELVSVSSGEFQGDAASVRPSISADGRYVAFESDADNLVVADSNGASDVFVRDRILHQTIRASVGIGGAEGDADSGASSISGDGARVAFESTASNFTPASGAPGTKNIFLRDLAQSRVLLISASADGSGPDGDSGEASIALGGDSVAFSSLATNLVAGGTNGLRNVYARDVDADRAERVSLGLFEQEPDGDCMSPSISTDGRYVAFATDGSNLMMDADLGTRDVLIRDRFLKAAWLESRNTATMLANFNSDHPAISADGRVLAFESAATNLVSGDVNGAVDVFVRDSMEVGAWGGLTDFARATLDLPVSKSIIRSAIAPHADVLSASGWFSFNAYSLTHTYSPSLPAEILVAGQSGEVLRVNIPTGDPHWRVAKDGAWSWTSPKGALPVVQLRLDPMFGKLNLDIRRADFESAPGGTMSIGLRLGGELGWTTQTWEPLPKQPNVLRLAP